MFAKKILLFGLFLLFLGGCGTSMKTQKLEMPKNSSRGLLSISVKPGTGIAGADVSRLKELLERCFEGAGYNKVSFRGSKGSREKSLEIVVTKFEHSSFSNNTGTAVGVGCTYLCIFVAPCLLLPGYNHPQFEVTAEITEYANGEEVFSKVMTERAVGSSNAFERGDEDFKKELEVLAVSNLAVAIAGQMDSR